MRRFVEWGCTALIVGLVGTGCGYQSIEPGHRGLRFEAKDGLKHDVIQPGKHNLGWCFLRDCGRIDDFDVTYSTKKEEIHTASQEGLGLDLRVSVIYRPIMSELYELDSEIGQNYYEEVIGPEFRSAARGVFAHHSYTELAQRNEKIEDEVEAEVQRRVRGKHVEIASVTLEGIGYAPEISNAVRARIVGEQEAIRQKAAMENESLRTQQKIQNTQAEAKLNADLELAKKRNERAIAEEDALLQKAVATATVTKAKADADAITIMARAHAEENRAQTQSISPLSVQMAAYEALGKLGGTGTTIMLGDFSRAPQFLFPPGYGGNFGLPFHAAPAAHASLKLEEPSVTAPKVVPAKSDPKPEPIPTANDRMF